MTTVCIEELIILQSIYPNAPEDILESILEAHDGSMENAQNYIDENFKDNPDFKKSTKQPPTKDSIKDAV
jgi:hypothetical protein